VTSRILLIVATCALIASTAATRADQTVPHDGTLVGYGHHHFNVSDVDAHLRFWIQGLGGTATSLEGMAVAVVRIPGTLLFLRSQTPKTAMSDTVVSRLRFSVQSLAVATRRLEAAGFDPAVTYAGTTLVRGPDDVMVELVESAAEPESIAYRELTLNAEDPQAMRAWYAQHLPGISAVSGLSVPLRAALPGTTLLFARPATRPRGTQGSALDHIGFEVDGLEAYCAELIRRGIVFERPYTKVPNTALAIAFFTDPWGTFIELTEGLDTVP
jgi:hypothetical protein